MLGKEIIDKHKGEVGRFIPWKDINPALKIDQIKFYEPGDVDFNENEDSRKYILDIWVAPLRSNK